MFPWYDNLNGEKVKCGRRSYGFSVFEPVAKPPCLVWVVCKLGEHIEEIIIAVLGFAGSIIGSFGGFKLISYRVEQLEKKVEKHNGVIDRVYKLEQETAVQDEKIVVANHRIDDLERMAAAK